MWTASPLSPVVKSSPISSPSFDHFLVTVSRILSSTLTSQDKSKLSPAYLVISSSTKFPTVGFATISCVLSSAEPVK